MPENENVDLTEELVVPVEELERISKEKKERIKYYEEFPEESPKMETPIRSAMDLMDVPYSEMTEEEKEYFISALKMRNTELDEIAKKAFEENRRLRESRRRELNIVEDSLTFIKNATGNNYAAVCLAIKNLEREVTKYGN